MVVFVCCLVCVACLFLARATESWLGGFHCMSPVLVLAVAGGLRPASETGAIFSLAALAFCTATIFLYAVVIS